MSLNIHAPVDGAGLGFPPKGTATARICARCVLPENFPGIKLDDRGVCNYCRAYRQNGDKEAKAEQLRTFEQLIGETQNRGSAHDVVLAFNGGQDSTYTMHLLRRRFGLRVLAVTMDNGFISSAAMDNMRRITARLGVDQLIVRPNPAVMRQIFRISADRNLYPGSTLLRASSICTSCISIVKGVVLRTAVEKNIPFVGYGWSPGQVPVQAAVMKVNPHFARMAQSALYEPLHAVIGDAIKPYFLEDRQFWEIDRFPWNIHPLAFLDYNKEEIVRTIGELGWKMPLDTDPNSTTCLLNVLGNKLHIERYGFNPYSMEVAGIVRAGGMSREDGLAKLAKAGDEATLRYVEQILYDGAKRPSTA